MLLALALAAASTVQLPIDARPAVVVARAAIESRASGLQLTPKLLDTGTGAIVVAFEPHVGDLPVLSERLTVVLDRSLKVVARFGALTKGPLLGSFGPSPAPGARQIAWPQGGALHAAWYFIRDERAVIEAGGQVLRTWSLEAPFSYRVWADSTGAHQPFDGPQGLAVSPYPAAAPLLIEPTLIQSELVAVNGDTWLAAGATTTTGNNVDAFADLTSPDGFGTGDLRADVTSAGVFDRAFATDQGPDANDDQIKAAVTQAFFTTNWVHDWFYEAGFDEAAGNAQQSNMSRGGREGDPLLVAVHHFGSRSNAFMRVRPDGTSPMLLVGIYDATDRAVVSASGQSYVAGFAQFGAQSFDVTGRLVLAVDGAAPTDDACTALTNAAAIAGNVALVARGTCNFTDKVRLAQMAGAIAVIVINNAPGPLALPGVEPLVTIGSLGVGQAEGGALRTAAQSGTVMAQLQRTPRTDRDGALDGAVLTHEYTHLVSNRLVGDVAGLFHPQGLALGEGWSDFAALLFVARAADADSPFNSGWSGSYAFGGYARSGLIPDSYYYGSRRLPYSADFAKNALTFKHIGQGVALPAVPAPRFGQDGSANTVRHQAGEVWASMLWQCFTALLLDPRNTFDAAHLRMRKYLVASLAATPLTPTYVEARDALLAVAYATDPLDHALFVKAFAKRGMGPKAVAPDRTSTTLAGVVEDFDGAAPAVHIEVPFPGDSLVSCDGDGQLDRGEAGRLEVKITNTSAAPLSGLKLTVMPVEPSVRVLEMGPIAVPDVKPTETVTARASLVIDPVFVGADVGVVANVTGAGVTAQATARFAVDFRTLAGGTDDVEVEPSPWVLSAGAMSPDGAQWVRGREAPQNHFWHASTPNQQGDVYLTSPPLTVGSGQLTLRFQHRHQLGEDSGGRYEGGVIELSDDDGVSYRDVGAMATPGYGGTVGGTPNALSGRPAFTGTSAGYPAWVPVSLDLGTAYAGKTVRMRFRYGGSPEDVAFGWDVDDIEVSGITGRPFNSLSTELSPCMQRPPAAVVGPDQTARGGDTVQLDGSMSWDLDGDPLGYAWTQVEGPTAALMGGGPRPTFVAPYAGGVLRFNLVVNDGTKDSVPATATVTVEPAPEPPGKGCGCSGAEGLFALLALACRLQVTARKRLSKTPPKS